MKRIPFWKMSGSGNDFILIDNRRGLLQGIDLKRFVARVCRRRISVGADGVILIEEPTRGADFRWRYFNADGGEVEMCGNGSRCAARFALLQGIAQETMTFETLAGLVRAEVREGRVKVRLPDSTDLHLDLRVPIDGKEYPAAFLNTGVPHVVYFVEDLEGTDVLGLGRKTRYHDLFAPAGANANFVRVLGSRRLAIRTYERGVEDETLACGTGAIAAACVAAAWGKVSPPVDLLTRSGLVLTVYFRREGNRFRDVFLEGDAQVIYSGELWEEAWLSGSQESEVRSQERRGA